VEAAMMWNSWGGWMHGDGWLFGFVFWIVIVLGVVLAAAIWGAIRRTEGHTAEGHGVIGAGLRETPLDILQKRYARGDISKEEFEEKRRDLA
jgi:putative membrane protein